MKTRKLFIIVAGKCKNQVDKGTPLGFALYEDKSNTRKEWNNLCCEGSSSFVYAITANYNTAKSFINKQKRTNIIFVIRRCYLTIED